MDCTDEMSQFHQFQKQTVKQQLEKTRYQQRRVSAGRCVGNSL